MVRQNVIALALAAWIVGLVQTAHATVIVLLSFEKLVESADLVFRGSVTRIQARWVETRDGTAIVTRVTFFVERMLKGETREQVSLDFLGGRIGDYALEVTGVPQFTIGQRDVVCARSGDGHISPLTGFNQGRFQVVRDRTGRDYVRAYDGRAFSNVAQLGIGWARLESGGIPPMTLAAFEEDIARLVRFTR